MNSVSPQYHRFLDFFTLSQRERLDGLDSSYFELMTPSERQEAFNYLEQRAEKSEENLRGMYHCDPDKAIQYFKLKLKSPTEKQATKREEEAVIMGKIIMAGYICNFDPTKDNIDTLVSINVFDCSEYARNTFYNLIPSIPTTNKSIETLEKAIHFETERLGLASAILKLMSTYGMEFDPTDPLYKRIYKGLKSNSIQDKKQALAELKQTNAPVYAN